jgi:hypothetical protein
MTDLGYIGLIVLLGLIIYLLLRLETSQGNFFTFQYINIIKTDWRTVISVKKINAIYDINPDYTYVSGNPRLYINAKTIKIRFWNNLVILLNPNSKCIFYSNPQKIYSVPGCISLKNLGKSKIYLIN